MRLNQKAAKLSVRELMEITLIKFQNVDREPAPAMVSGKPGSSMDDVPAETISKVSKKLAVKAGFHSEPESSAAQSSTGAAPEPAS